MLTQIDVGLWEALYPLRFVGVPMTARMTVVELRDGGLFVHSPGRLTPELREAVDELGPVAAVVASNRFHHVFVGQWREAYPNAECHVAPGLARKRKDLDDVHQLCNSAPPTWAEQLDQHVVEGIPMIGEVVFYHRATRTLINTDITHNVHSESSWLARTIWRFMGSYGKFGPSRLERWVTRDRAALRQSVTRILDWDFDRVIVAHGDVLATGGKDEVRRGFQWVLGD